MKCSIYHLSALNIATVRPFLMRTSLVLFEYLLHFPYYCLFLKKHLGPLFGQKVQPLKGLAETERPQFFWIWLETFVDCVCTISEKLQKLLHFFVLLLVSFYSLYAHKFSPIEEGNSLHDSITLNTFLHMTICSFLSSLKHQNLKLNLNIFS